MDPSPAGDPPPQKQSVFDTTNVRRSLRDLSDGKLRENVYARMHATGRTMPPWLFPSLLTGLTLLRIFCIAVLVASYFEWFVDPSSWATGSPVTASHHTPFHGHPNLYGWRFAFQGLVGMHVVTGAGLLLVCLVPLLSRKGGRVHVLFGRVFVALWAVHLLDGLINSAQILLTRGFEPTRYLDSTRQGFSLYLYVQFSFISALVVDFLAHGLAALHLKNRRPSGLVRGVMLALPVTTVMLGAIMALWAVYHLALAPPGASPAVATEYAIVYLVQVPAYVFLAGKNIAYWLRPEPRVWLQGWVTEHQRNLMFCVGVTIYTALANVTMRFAPQLTAPVFASIDVGFIVWLLTKERFLRRDLVGGRLGLAVASFLRGGPRTAPRAFDERDALWILRMFDKNRNDKLEPDELYAVLAAHGISLTSKELIALFEGADRDGDGRLDARELAAFLAGGFEGEASRDDELAFIFRRLDADGDGRVSGAELSAAFGDGRSDVEKLRQRVDDKRSRGIGYQTFEKAVESRRRPPG